MPVRSTNRYRQNTQTDTRRLKRLLSMGALAPLLAWSTGVAAFNQSSSSMTNAAAILDAALNLASGNFDSLTQSATGTGNQDAEHDATADMNASASVDMDADNVAGITQAGPGTGAGNQSAMLGAGALTFLALGIDSSATNASLLAQMLTGGTANQDADVDLQAGSDILTELNGGATNFLDIVQAMSGGPGNQAASADADAITVGQHVTGGDAGNVNILGQSAGGGSANQTAASATSANNFITAIQNLITTNNLQLQQICGSMCNQDADATLLAVTAGAQLVGGNATNVNLIGQEADGPGAANQDLDNAAEAVLGLSGSQDNEASNEAVVFQGAGNGQSNQEAPVNVLAVNESEQALLGEASNLNFLFQDASGDDAGNQSMTNGASAVGLGQATQDNEATNVVGVFQIGGSGQSNQNAPVNAIADLDASQAVQLGVGSANFLSQTGGSNQAMDNESDAFGLVGASQDADAGNAVGVFQVGGSGQGNQNSEVNAVAAGEADQNLGLSAFNENDLTQESSGDGSANQWAQNAASAIGILGASQDLDVGNDVGVFQVNGAGQGSQNAEVDAIAVGDADQNVGVLVGNGNSIEQLAQGDGSSNQSAENDTEAVGVAGASQDVDVANNVEVFQQNGGTSGAAAQSVEIAPTAVVDADQNVGVLAGNDNSIFQDPSSANQNATNDASAVGLVGADQDASAVNNVATTQSLGLTNGAGAQWLGVTPTAVVDADQNVGVVAANGNDIEQMADGDGSGNQDIDNDADATGAAGASQSANAINNVNLIQGGTANHGAIAQAGMVTPTAIVDADQNVGAGAGNQNSLSQDAGDGSSNQGIGNDVSADAAVDADQDASAINNVNATQFCNVSFGACAQYFETAPTATTQATQNAGAAAQNTNDISQQGGDGSSNQDVDNAATADAAVDADQDATSQNDENIVQVCTVTGGACAQYHGSTQNAATTADQTVIGASGNENTIEQDAGDGDMANQAAANDASAATDIEADQTAESMNELDVEQTADGSASANQAATAEQDATTDSSQQIVGTSGNANEITQTGGADMSNQAADNTADALTTIDADQDTTSGNATTMTQEADGNANQQADVDSDATTTSTLQINGNSSNNTTINQH